MNLKNLIPNSISSLFATRKSTAAPLINNSKRTAASIYSETAIDELFQAMMQQPDPDMILKSIGKTRRDLRALDTDDEIKQAIDTRKDACLCAAWRLEKLESPQDNFIEEQLNIFIKDIIDTAFNSLPFGYSVAERIYKKESGLIALSQITEKPFEWFEPRNDGTLIWITQHGTREEVDTEFKFLLTVRNPSYRNPYGEALYSQLYYPWFFRHNVWLYWIKYMDRFSDPLVLGKVENPVDMITGLSKLGITNAVAVNPSEDVKAIFSTGAGEFERIEITLSKRIQKSILGQTLTSDITGGGSYAASKTHNEVRREKRDSDLRVIESQVQNVINALWILNRFSGEAPVFKFQSDNAIDTVRAERDVALKNAGICSFTSDYLLRTYDYKEGDIVIENANMQNNLDSGLSQFAKQFAANEEKLPENRIANRLAVKADPIISNWIDILKKRNSEAKDLSELKQNIQDAFPEISVEALAEVMMQHTLIAKCVGMMEVASEITGVEAPNEIA